MRDEYYDEHIQHKAKEAKDDQRHEAVERMVDDSMREGGEYYPFNSDNVIEALVELCFADQAMLASYVKMCHDKSMDFDTHTHLADFMVDRVNDYWHKIAVKKAQEQYDKARF